MRMVLRILALLLALVSYAFGVGSLLVALGNPDERWSMLLGTILLTVIGTFFAWRFRALRR